MDAANGRIALLGGLWGAAAVAGGFTCLYTVAIVFFYCDWLFELPGADAVRYGVLLNGGLCLAAAGVLALARTGRLRTLPVVLAGTACYAAALALVALAYASGSLACAYGAGAAAGLGAGALMPLWFDRMGLLPGNHFAYVLGAASLVSTPAALALDAVSLPVLLVVCAVFVLASSALLVALDPPVSNTGTPQPEPPPAKAGEDIADEPRPIRRLAAPLAYVAILSVAYGVLDVVAMANPLVTAEVSGTASLAGGLVADVMFLLYVRFDGRRYTALLNVSLAITATGLLFLPFLGGTYSVVLVVLVHLGWSISLLVLFALVIEIFRGQRMRLVAWAALAFAFPRPGVALGTFLAALVAVDNRFAFAQMTVVAFALLYLILMGAWLLRTREKRAAEAALRKRDELIRRYLRARDDVQGLACDDLASAHGLTKRETEILKLLAQGRDAAHIEQALFLSRNTVKSYSKTLYAKLGVHSKQEVIDLVKSSLPLEDEGF